MDYKKNTAQLKLIQEVAPDQLETKDWKEIRRDRLINSLNRVNFYDGQVALVFRHQKYNSLLSVYALPQPCRDNHLICNWLESLDYLKKFNSYIFDHFYITDGFRKTLVKAKLVNISSQWVKFNLPENCIEICVRKVRRHNCQNVSFKLSQDGLFVEGDLKSFSAVSFSVYAPNDYRNVLKVFDKESPLNIILTNQLGVMFSGSCEIYRISNDFEGSTIVLKPLLSQIQRYKSKEFRSIRQKLLPMPNIVLLIIH